MDIFQWLKQQGYEYTWNVKLGTRTPDIIAFNENEVVAFEIKKHATEIAKAIGQCLHYLDKANRVYVVLPSSTIKSIQRVSINILKKHGIGLLEMNDFVKILLKPKWFFHDNKNLIKKLKEEKMSPHITPHTNIKERILEILNKHPEGLTFTQIAREIGIHRHNIPKYIHELKGEGIVLVRDLKTLKLCYLKKYFQDIENFEALKKRDKK